MAEKRPKEVFVLLIFLQVADSFLSVHGIYNIGLREYEGNPLMIFLSDYFGFLPVLITVKTLAIPFIYLLYRKGESSVLWFLSGFYFMNFINQVRFFVEFNGWV